MGMLDRYEEFLKKFDKKIAEYFIKQEQYIKCKKSCSACCEIGEYPFSRLEAEYIMHGFVKLSPIIQAKIKQNIKNLIIRKKDNLSERFLYKCPFLLDKMCALYQYRGITCRVFGLAYLYDNKVHLPECVNSGLNYSKNYNPETKEVDIQNLIEDDLRIDSVLRSPSAQEYNLECGEIRPLINWFL